MTNFRIVPAMRMEQQKRSGTRYGFPIFDHPRQDPSAGFFVASWATREEADAAAHCLGYLPNVVVPLPCYIPTTFLS